MKTNKPQQNILDALANGATLEGPSFGAKSYRLFPEGCEPWFEGRIVRVATVDALETAGLLTWDGGSYRLTTETEGVVIRERLAAKDAWLASCPVVVCPTCKRDDLRVKPTCLYCGTDLNIQIPEKPQLAWRASQWKEN